MNIVIRKADLDDMEQVWNLVFELAVFEKESEAVITSPEIYKRDFDAGLFEAHVAELDGIIVGLILYYYSYSTWKGKMLYLDDFVVKSEYRNHKIGSLLFDKLIAIAKKNEVSLIKWQVLDWNIGAINFYKKYNATIESEWYNGKLMVSDL